MDLSVSKFDLKGFARKLQRAKQAREPEEPDIYQDYTRLQDLNETFLKMYSDLLKQGAVNIRNVDFDGFEYYDLNDFYNFLETYNHGIFNFGETMAAFTPAVTPAVTAKPVFI